MTYAHGARRLRMLGMCVWSERESGDVSDTLFLSYYCSSSCRLAHRFDFALLDVGVVLFAFSWLQCGAS